MITLIYKPISIHHRIEIKEKVPTIKDLKKKILH